MLNVLLKIKIGNEYKMNPLKYTLKKIKSSGFNLIENPINQLLIQDKKKADNNKL